MNINPSDIATGLLGLGVIAGAVGLVALGGRDRTADQHDVADYRPTLHPSRRDWPLLDRQGPRRLRPHAIADLILPPAPAGTRVSLPLYAEQVVAEVMRARYGTTNRAAIAGGFLREIAAEQQDDDIIWTSTAGRDLVGAFPVVRAA
ncbi:hypothetical protein [Micromonospora sp. CB01531]|uniref:hypothetical protein n=1 Tax=Micromonospora sp. CB01531 TaxID=1718947 RepID=UPI0009397CF6|nr:hypothetical protein [Micromonospora sp. CB01531]OKI47271.1 hypothetical protein A6A27_10510 [Micromonospora sp. CB01531]